MKLTQILALSGLLCTSSYGQKLAKTELSPEEKLNEESAEFRLEILDNFNRERIFDGIPMKAGMIFGFFEDIDGDKAYDEGVERKAVYGTYLPMGAAIPSKGILYVRVNSRPYVGAGMGLSFSDVRANRTFLGSEDSESSGEESFELITGEKPHLDIVKFDVDDFVKKVIKNGWNEPPFNLSIDGNRAYSIHCYRLDKDPKSG